MARKVFFSFHYHRDLWRANVVRNVGVIDGISAAGFHDASIWEEANKNGDDAVKRLIDQALATSSVTIVLIGADTASRKYVSYEIQKSVFRGNGVIGIQIHNIKDKDGKIDPPGPIPNDLVKIGAPVYVYEYGKLGEWVEKTYKTANRGHPRHPR